MVLRWTEEAARDLERIAKYCFENTPDTAAELVLQLYKAPEALLIFPNRGRPGKIGTRELVLTPLPYLIVYSVAGETVNIVRILHGAQDRA